MLKQLRRFFPGDEWLPAKRQVTGKEGEWWKKLHRGSKLTFDRMAQAELSAQELVIGETCRYDFGSAHFVAYILERPEAREDEAPVAQIIVADGRREECYLAISRKLNAQEQTRLLDEEVFNEIKAGNTPQRIHVRATGVVAFTSWVVETYKKQIHGIRGKKTLHGVERYFEYTLFVSANNERAIEIEQYENGVREVYLTIYRPASDIVSIFHATRFEAADRPLPVLVRSEADKADEELENPESVTMQWDIKPSQKVEEDKKKEKEPESIGGRGLADIRAKIQLTVEQEREKLRVQSLASVAAIQKEVFTADGAGAPISPSQAKTTVENPSFAALVEEMNKSEDAFAEIDEGTDLAKEEEVVVAKPEEKAEKFVSVKEEVVAEKPTLFTALADVLPELQPQAIVDEAEKKADILPEETKEAEDDAEDSEQLMRTLQDVAAAVDDGSDDTDVVIAGSVPLEEDPTAVQIDCHIRVAARLIDEALRRDMRLEDVVRKALGIPIAPEEKVSFTLHLTDKEYQDLAERFGCSAHDKRAIHAAIVEDLVDFSGERSRLDALKPALKTAHS